MRAAQILRVVRERGHASAKARRWRDDRKVGGKRSRYAVLEKLDSKSILNSNPTKGWCVGAA